MYFSSCDGESTETGTAQADEQGQVFIETFSTRLGVYAYSSGGHSSGKSIIDVTQQINAEIPLRPTATYRGRILKQDGEPAADVIVQADVEIDLPETELVPHNPRLRGNTIKAVTDGGGNYSINGVPVETNFQLGYLMEEDGVGRVSMGERFITSGEVRPLDVHRIESESSDSAPAKSFRERAAVRLKDCQLYGLHGLVVVVGDDVSTEWATDMLRQYETIPPIGSYLPMVISINSKGNEEFQQKQDWLDRYGLGKLVKGEVAFLALSPNGEELGRQTFGSFSPDARSVAQEFFEKHEPAQVDARANLNDALSEAKKTQRMVWAQVSQTRCAPCFALSRWLDEHRAVLEKDLVFFKVDDVRDKHGLEVANQITGNRNFGVPFVAIMDAEGKVIIDGEGPLGNIGFPSSFEGTHHLRRMIETAAMRITPKELDDLIDSLKKLD